MFGTRQRCVEKLGLASIDRLPGISEFVPDASVVEALEMGLRIVPQSQISNVAPDTDI
jgi:segregation and condensation protein B